ncbi:MAG: DUF1492 domain-containing protein [Sporomusaceae bacterium]|nr:DUF1492 domain-containing protein [Sporomusaceae bacterium]
MQVENNRAWFSKTEGRLYAYPALMARHRELVEKLKEIYPVITQGIGGEAAGTTGTHSDKTAMLAIKINALGNACDESILKAIKEIELMQNFLELCSWDEKEFVEMRYFKNWAIITIIREMAISRSTYYRLQKTIITRAAAIFGYLKHEEYVKTLA